MSDDKIFYGKVIWFDPKRGMGFILWEIEGVKQKDMFVHFSDLNMEGFKTLYKDQNVQFQLGVNKKGEPKATFVVVLKN